MFQRVSLAVFGALAMPVVAFAQSADPVITAIEDFGDKVTTYAAPVLTMAAIGAGIWLGVKYLKKAASKA